MTILLILICFWVLLVLSDSTIQLFFLTFDFEKNKKVTEYLYQKLMLICENEKIGVYIKSIQEINKENKNGDEAVGRYYYLLNTELMVKCEDVLNDIKKIENCYNIEFSEYCKQHNMKYYEKEIFTYPRILLADDLNLKSRIGVFIHELGHHFAVKEKGKNHDEQDADNYAVILINKHLPFFVKAIYDIRFDIKLTRLQKIFALFTYIKFMLWHKNS